MTKRSHRVRRWFIRIVWICVGSLVLVCVIYLLWYFNRPLPTAVTNQPLFEGVTYTRVVDAKAPLIYHVVRVDLTAPGIDFLATPGDDIEDFVYSARTTAQFLEEYGVQVAINGDFFDPWWSYHPLDYYPHVGDGVNGRGLAIANGEVVTPGFARQGTFRTLYITDDHQASFTPPAGKVQTAISGNTMILENGQPNPRLFRRANVEQRHPRTAVAVDERGQILLLFVVDGRQPGYSRGATMQELVHIIQAQGGYSALNLDGGGSSTLIIQSADGQAQQLGSAIHTRIPYRQRPVANHFGVFARPLQP